MCDAPVGEPFLELFKGIFGFFRDMSTPLVEAFDDASALARPEETLNHALWLVGHMSWVADSLLAEIPHGTCFRNTAWDPLFAIGRPKAPDAAYPPFGAVGGRFKEVLAALEALIETLSPDDLVKPCAGKSDWFPTPMDGMIHFVRDANYHLGQLSYLRKLV